jgi:hypothetical protein
VVANLKSRSGGIRSGRVWRYKVGGLLLEGWHEELVKGYNFAGMLIPFCHRGFREVFS